MTNIQNKHQQEFLLIEATVNKTMVKYKAKQLHLSIIRILCKYTLT